MNITYFPCKRHWNDSHLIKILFWSSQVLLWKKQKGNFEQKYCFNHRKLTESNKNTSILGFEKNFWHLLMSIWNFSYVSMVQGISLERIDVKLILYFWWQQIVVNAVNQIGHKTCLGFCIEQFLVICFSPLNIYDHSDVIEVGILLFVDDCLLSWDKGHRGYDKI